MVRSAVCSVRRVPCLLRGDGLHYASHAGVTGAAVAIEGCWNRAGVSERVSTVRSASSRKSRRRGPAAGAPDRASRRHLLLPAAIVAGAFAVRVVVLLQLGRHPLLQPGGVLDDAVYVQLARRVASGDLALAPGAYFLPPLYAYFLGLVFALTDGSIAAARFVQVALGTLAVHLNMQTAAAWFGARAGLVTGILTAATGLFVFNELLVLQSSIDPFLTALALACLTRALHGGSRRAFWLAGMSCAALALNRPNAIPVVAAVAVTWIAVQGARAAWRQTLAFVLGAALLIGPVALRNRLVAGEWVAVTSHGGLNFYIGNSEPADGTWKLVPGITPSVAGQASDAQRVAGDALGRTVSAGEASSYFYGRARQWIVENPGAWARLLARKLALVLSASDAALNYSYSYYARDEATLLPALVVGPWMIVPLGLFGLVAAAPRARRAAYLTWTVVPAVYALSLVAFFVSSRYRLPLFVPLLAGAGAAVDWLWSRGAARRTRPLVVAGVVLAALFGLTNWPIAVDDGRLNEREERIVQLIDAGEVERAERLLADTEARHPNPITLLLRAGVSYLDRGEVARAVDVLERASTRRDDPAVRLVLGEALVAAGRPGDALTHLEAARAAGVAPARAAVALVGAYQALGRSAEAHDTLASVVVSPETDGRLLLGMGAAALQLEDAPLAERLLRAAVARLPDMAGAREQLGFALGLQRKDQEAVTELETAVRLDPASPSARFFLALAYLQQERLADARVQLEQVLRLRPDHPQAAELLSTLPPAR
jgi:tetratricopeptide (TPR) repeat protein